MMDKFAVIRSVVGCVGDHDGYQCMSGWPRRDSASIGGRPSIGSIIAKVQGPVNPSIPPFVALADRTSHRRMVGTGHRPASSARPIRRSSRTGRGCPTCGSTASRSTACRTAKALLKGLDHLKRSADASGMLAGMDAFSEAAFGVLTSSKLADALDLSKEDPRIRARYGDGKPYHFQYDGAPTVNDHLLIARRLVEAGVRCVTLSYGRWDSHGDNFGLVRDHGPKLDQAVTALVQDLEERGMLDDVTVVVWGEFGRSAANQQGCRPRSLAARQLRAVGRRRHADRPGDRCDQPPGRIRRSAGPVHMQQIVADDLPQPGDRSTTRRRSSIRPAARATSSTSASRSTSSFDDSRTRGCFPAALSTNRRLGQRHSVSKSDRERSRET